MRHGKQRGGVALRRTMSKPVWIRACRSPAAAAAQVGTAYPFTPEAKIHDVYRSALNSSERATAITNVFTGRPIRSAAEAAGRDELSQLWAGESFALAKPMSAASLTRSLAARDV